MRTATFRPRAGSGSKAGALARVLRIGRAPPWWAIRTTRQSAAPQHLLAWDQSAFPISVRLHLALHGFEAEVWPVRNCNPPFTDRNFGARQSVAGYGGTGESGHATGLEDNHDREPEKEHRSPPRLKKPRQTVTVARLKRAA